MSTFSYGANLSRFKQTKGTETTIYLDKLVEITLDGGETRTKTYIDDIAIVERIDTVGQDIPDHQLRFTHRDRLGSVVTLTDHNNNITEQRSFDPFGKPRNGDLSDAGEATLIGTNDGFKPFSNRGFTDHEHLDDAELIHMNGRAYDYNLGRFLSVDPFVQAPGNSQSMNPYSYIMNNPLAGTDPSGYIAECEQALGKGCGDDEPKKERRDPRSGKGFGWETVWVNPDSISNGSQQNGYGAKSNESNQPVETLGNKPVERAENLGESLEPSDTEGSITPLDSIDEFKKLYPKISVSGNTKESKAMWNSLLELTGSKTAREQFAAIEADKRISSVMIMYSRVASVGITSYHRNADGRNFFKKAWDSIRGVTKQVTHTALIRVDPSNKENFFMKMDGSGKFRMSLTRLIAHEVSHAANFRGISGEGIVRLENTISRELDPKAPLRHLSFDHSSSALGNY